jgi:hypothetical protein
VENRLRERYRLEGVPAIIDFVERGEQRVDTEPARHARRPRTSGGSRRGPRDAAA